MPCGRHIQGATEGSDCYSALHTSCVCRIGHLGTSCVMRPRAEVGTVDSTLPPQELRRYRGRRSPAWNIQ
jgi:hypothetical protein